MGVGFNWLIFSREAAVLWAAGRYPGSSLSGLSRMLGLNYITVRGCVRRLLGAGLLRVESSGKAFRVFLTKEGREALLKVSAALSAVEGLGAFKPINLDGLGVGAVKVLVSPEPSNWARLSAGVLKLLEEAFRDECFLKAAAENGAAQIHLSVELSAENVSRIHSVAVKACLDGGVKQNVPEGLRRMA